MDGSITYEEYMARFSKEERREIARNSARMSADCLVMHVQADAEEFLEMTPKEKHMVVMLEMARIEAEWLANPKKAHTQPKNSMGHAVVTTYRELLGNFSDKQQRAIKRGARFLQAKYERLYAQTTPQPKIKPVAKTKAITPPTKPAQLGHI